MEIRDQKELKAAIAALEHAATIKKQIMTDQFHITYENLQPVNILKDQLRRLIGSTELQNDATSAAMGLGAGMLSKKFYEGSSPNIFKQFLGSALEFGVAKMVANNSDKIKEVAAGFLDKLFKTKEKAPPAK
ncbi:MAG TPA: hypothetical protein VK559_13510 [Ferruginibacter sp.]|nr:hypothetical protein [Ferruginibacter sp.]